MGNSLGVSVNGDPFRSCFASASVPPTPRREDDILKRFTFNDLKIATRNFRPDSVQGEGGFGCVFKGWIDEHTWAPAKPGAGLVIAVKKFEEGPQGQEEWLAEVSYLGQLSHPHLVKLVGYCLEDEQRLLVYEFMPRGSLENHLFRRSSYTQPLSWNLRMKIALGAARGLAFLHSDMAKVIFRDFKTLNVFLDSNYDAKLSGFGFAKDGPADGKSHVCTCIMGTLGYAAPEYLTTGHLSTKSDVYSFGVVLLEMLSGRRAIDENRHRRMQKLVDWATPYLVSKRKSFHILDPRLGGQDSEVGAQKATVLALQCLSTEPKYRPSMDQVVSALEQLQDAKDIERNPQSEQKPNGRNIRSRPKRSVGRRSKGIV